MSAADEIKDKMPWKSLGMLAKEGRGIDAGLDLPFTKAAPKINVTIIVKRRYHQGRDDLCCQIFILSSKPIGLEETSAILNPEWPSSESKGIESHPFNSSWNPDLNRSTKSLGKELEAPSTGS